MGLGFRLPISSASVNCSLPDTYARRAFLILQEYRTLQTIFLHLGKLPVSERDFGFVDYPNMPSSDLKSIDRSKDTVLNCGFFLLHTVRQPPIFVITLVNDY